jgi:hypothetical protein
MSPLLVSPRAALAALVSLSVLSTGIHAFGVAHPLQVQVQMQVKPTSFLSTTALSYGRNDYDSYESRGGGGGGGDRRSGGNNDRDERRDRAQSGGGGRHDYERYTSDDNSNVNNLQAPHSSPLFLFLPLLSLLLLTAYYDSSRDDRR